MSTAEQSIKDQIAAMESWALQISQKIKSTEYKPVEELLRKLIQQGRRLEWRGGKSGLKHLPELAEVITIKKNISEARAAIEQIEEWLKKIEKLPLKEKKKLAEPTLITEKDAKYLKKLKENIAILITVLQTARELATSRPWFNPEILSKVENKKFLLELLQGRRYYGNFSEHDRYLIMNRINFKRIHFEHGDDLSYVKLMGLNLSGVNFRSVDLHGARFDQSNLHETNFQNADLHDAYLCGINLQNANFQGADLSWANLTSSDLTGALFWGANIKKTILYGVKGLTTEQLHSAENWEKALLQFIR